MIALGVLAQVFVDRLLLDRGKPAVQDDEIRGMTIEIVAV